MGDRLAISAGLLQAPLNPLKTDVSRGPPGLSGGPGPLGLHRNSTTGYSAQPGPGAVVCTAGRMKSEHAGRLAAFDSQLTIIHSARLAVFSVNNGPLYSARFLHPVLHFLILDSVIANNRTPR